MFLAATDGVDGWIARRHGTTRSGAFLDPLADKVLIFGAMAMLVAIERFWWVPVALIGIRELAVSLLRVQYGRRGLAIPATKGAKLKTLVQALAVGAALLPGIAENQSVDRHLAPGHRHGAHAGDRLAVLPSRQPPGVDHRICGGRRGVNCEVLGGDRERRVDRRSRRPH